MKPSDAANDNLVERTLALWRSRLRRDLSREDARQIAGNVTGFFNILAEWSRAEMRPENESGTENANQSENLFGEGQQGGAP